MNKYKVFIATNSLQNYDQIQCLFNNDGYNVVGYSQDGNETLNKILELKPDLVFIEENLKNVDADNIILKVNPTLLTSQTSFVIISHCKTPYLKKFYSEYNVLDVLYLPIANYELMNIRKIFIKHINYLYNLKENKKYIIIQNKLKEYKYIRNIDYSKYFSNDDLLLLNKLEIDISLKRLYTEAEHESIQMDLVGFWDGAKDIYGNKLPPARRLEYTGVSRDDFNRIYDILLNIETMYT